MALKEQRAYKVLMEKSQGTLNCKRIENQNGSGMSDFVVQGHNGIDIWLELKALDALPVRGDTKVLKGAFEKGQLPFLREKISWGGHGFVGLRCGEFWWLFDPTTEVAEIRKAYINEKCIVHGTVKDIINYLEQLKYEDIPYAAPNYRPGTKRRKAQFCVPDGTGNGENLADAG
jgi:hypothetical protein